MNQPFEEIVKQAHAKMLTVASSYPEPYLKAMRDLIDRLLDTGASIDEARIAMQQLNNDWGLIPQGSAQTAHLLATEKI